MSSVTVSLSGGMTLREAAERLFKSAVQGAPVVDSGGRCVGVLSVSDLARLATRGTGPGELRTCSHQETHRGLRGRETVLCTFPSGRCPLQSEKHLPDDRVVLACQQPHTVLMEWRIAEIASLPAEDVRHYMTAEPVMAVSSDSISTLARQMIDAKVHRVIVVDGDHRPVGIVSSSDLVGALARLP